MPTSMKLLADDDVRRTAIMVHDRSFLVEAGAGSGKTAIMAGRIAMLLAEGVAPKAIAAVTFTELAASELLFRVREFVRELALYRVPPQLHVALPVGLSEAQLRNITRAHFAIDEITCSTIHGFCQRLIKPYPVEADIDPGAIVMDRNQADLAFTEIGDAWLRQELASDNGGLLAEMVLEDPNKTEELIKTILGHLRRQHAIIVDAPTSLAPFVMTYRRSVDDFIAFLRDAGIDEPETAAIVARFSEMSKEMTFPLADESPSDLVQ
ncbi:MAG: UvrD-helicase domain-containing protein, partial [Nitrosospira sp.]